MTTNLKYNIASRILSGKMEKLTIKTQAGSGGRSGSKSVKENVFLANDVFSMHIGGPNSKGTHNYGPIPVGVYILKIHEYRENWIKLVPNVNNMMFGRSGFAIHGRGKTGSHGCIVPYNFQVIGQIINVLKNNPQKKYTLEVFAMGNLSSALV